MSIVILLIGGLVTKVFGFVIKILFTRIVGTEGISLYTIVMPTYSLLITIATFSLPVSISKLVSEKKARSKTILWSTTCFILAFNVLFMISVLLSSSFIANHLLKQRMAKPLIDAMAYTLPFISLSSILKGYFLGKQNVIPNTISNFLEQLLRIFFLLFVLPLFSSCTRQVIFFILVNILTELISITTFWFFLPKKVFFDRKSYQWESSIVRQMLSISIPSVSSRFIGNVGFFLEPIILTNLLLYVGYSNAFILEEYAYYNAYAIGLLTLPSFFIASICQVLIPEISKFHARGEIRMIRKRMQQALVYSFGIGFCSSMIILVFRDYLLQLLYHTNGGSNYIMLLAPFFVLFYLEAPLSSALQALDKGKETMKITLKGIVLKLVVMGLLSFLKIGLYCLVFSEIINIIYVVYSHMKIIRLYFHHRIER